MCVCVSCVCVCACVRACMHACMHVCVRVYACMCVCVAKPVAVELWIHLYFKQQVLFRVDFLSVTLDHRVQCPRVGLGVKTRTS